MAVSVICGSAARPAPATGVACFDSFANGEAIIKKKQRFPVSVDTAACLLYKSSDLCEESIFRSQTPSN